MGKVSYKYLQTKGSSVGVNKLESLSLGDLIKLCRTGDKQAWDQFFRHYTNHINQQIIRTLLNRQHINIANDRDIIRDIYIEIVVDANSNTKNNRYYGSASVSLKNFDASTASGRGSSYYQTVPPAMSTVSEEDALKMDFRILNDSEDVNVVAYGENKRLQAFFKETYKLVHESSKFSRFDSNNITSKLKDGCIYIVTLQP